MDEKQIKQALNDIAQDGIGEDVDLWNRIQHRIRHEKYTGTQKGKPSAKIRRFIPLRIASRLVAGTIAFLFMGMVAYAFYQFGNFNIIDEGLQAVERTELNLSQSNGGITVTINWAYADAHRIAIAYSTVVDMQYYTSPPTVTFVDLQDNNGNVFLPSFGGGGGGGGGANNEETIILYGENISNFDASTLQGNPEELTLHYELVFDEFVADTGQSGSSDGGSGGGSGGSSGGGSGGGSGGSSGGGSGGSSGGGSGGGGGGGNGDSASIVTPIPTDASTENNLPARFVFDFTVPFIPAQIIEPDDSVTMNGVTLSLESISVTPSMTIVDVCYTGLNNEDVFMPYVMIETADMTVGRIGSSELYNEDDQLCSSAQYLESLYEQTGTWTITIPYLRGLPDYSLENVDTYLAILADNGVVVAQNTIEQLPPNIPFISGLMFETSPNIDAVLEMADTAISEIYEGPWVFTITYP